MNSIFCRSGAALATVIGVLATIAACAPHIPSEPADTLGASYVALIEADLASGTLTEFETEVLSRAKVRGTISRSDYETAHARYRECMASRGIQVQERRYPNGIIHSTPPGPHQTFSIDDLADANFVCGVGTTAAIDQLYSVQQGNPDLLRDGNEAGAACLIREGVAPTSFSPQDFATAFGGPGRSSTWDSLPFDVRDERVQMCLYVAGIVIGFAE